MMFLLPRLFLTSRLQTDEGLHLMEILARMAKIQMADVAELSYVFLLFIEWLLFLFSFCSHASGEKQLLLLVCLLSEDNQSGLKVAIFFIHLSSCAHLL